ncbi:MAG TPA: minor capsid protein [Nitrospira sp.]|nr:minor capsid protein [Nitrospira sp.]
MSVERDIVEGVAELIDAAGLATFHPSGVYADSETGIVFKVVPAKPDRVVILTAVPMTDDISMPLGQVMLQVRTRGLPNNPLDVDDLAGPIFDLLQGRTYDTFGDTTVIQMRRTTSIPNGQDAAERFERIDQFYLDCDVNPTVNRPFWGSW